MGRASMATVRHDGVEVEPTRRSRIRAGAAPSLEPHSDRNTMNNAAIPRGGNKAGCAGAPLRRGCPTYAPPCLQCSLLLDPEAGSGSGTARPGPARPSKRPGQED